MPNGITGAARPVHVRFRFTVEVDGFTSFGFNKMSELSAEVAEIAYYEGGAAKPIKVPGRVTVTDVTLTRGAGLDLEMYLWFKQVIDLIKDGGLVANDYKRNLEIVQRDNDGSEIIRWKLTGGWPKKFNAGEWDNDSDEATIQELVLAIDDFELVESPFD